MNHQLSAAIFTTYAVIFVVMRGYWKAKADRRPVQESKSFTLDRINVALVSLFCVVIPLVALHTPLLQAFDFPLPEALVWLSIPVLLAGLGIFWLSHRDLGENWSVTLELKEGHTLVTRGIFEHVRHPMYLSLWLCVIGQALCVPNYLGGVGSVAIWGLLYFVRIGREERMMTEKFGDQYRAYAQRTKRLIPGLY